MTSITRSQRFVVATSTYLTSRFRLSGGITISRHCDERSSVTSSSSHKFQDGCRRQDFGPRIFEPRFEFCLLVPGHNELKDFSHASQVMSRLRKFRPPYLYLLQRYSRWLNRAGKPWLVMEDRIAFEGSQRWRGRKHCLLQKGKNNEES